MSPRLSLGVLFCLSVFTLPVLANGDTDGVHAQIQRGAQLYAENCAVCHGSALSGLSEARLRFPEEHRRCERCHRRNNPPQMELSAMTWRNAFSIGDAPGLRGPALLQRFPTAPALYSYLKALMPRPFPGALSDQAYLDLTAFLYEQNQAELREALDLENLTDLP